VILDIFNEDAFGVVDLTTSINKLPYVPNRLDRMGIFTREGLTTPTAFIEESHGKLSLVPTRARGNMSNVNNSETRKLRPFRVPHIPLNDSVMADDVSGIRVMGTEDQLEAITVHVNNKMTRMKQNLEVTREYHRIGAVKGIVLDADGTTEVYDFFDEFGVSQEVVDFDFATPESMKKQALAVIRLVEDALGATPYQSIYALCGDDFFDAFIENDEVAASFETASDNEFARTQQANVQGNEMNVFWWGGIGWINYRGKIGSVPFIDPEEAHFFPVGAPELFMEFNAPAPFVETVNTIGQPFYAKQERMKWDVGVELHTQTNSLFMCTRPKCLVKATATFPA
jgi:hypothetical protein